MNIALNMDMILNSRGRLVFIVVSVSLKVSVFASVFVFCRNMNLGIVISAANNATNEYTY